VLFLGQSANHLPSSHSSSVKESETICNHLGLLARRSEAIGSDLRAKTVGNQSLAMNTDLYSE
jgi:hypothetical protein